MDSEKIGIGAYLKLLTEREEDVTSITDFLRFSSSAFKEVLARVSPHIQTPKAGLEKNAISKTETCCDPPLARPT